MTINGVLRRVNEPKVNGEYTTQTIVLDTDLDTQYPQQVQVELSKKLLALADTLHPGDIIEAEINIRGRDYIAKDGTTGNFTGLQAWRINKKGSEGVYNAQGNESNEKPTESAASVVDDSSDSPF